MKKKSLMLDDKKKKGKKKDPHTAKWKRCFKKVSKKVKDDAAAAICTDSVGYEDSFKKKSQHKESIDENKIVSLIKEKENPRMTKKGLLEYIKTKKVIKKVSKEDMIKESMGELSNIGKKVKYLAKEPGVMNKIRKYLNVLRDTGLENMLGVAPILNWTMDDLHRYLYGKRMDLESLENRLDDEDYENQYTEELIEQITYLLDNKQEIRDILIRAALRRAEESDDYNDNTIQRYFLQAAKDAWGVWAGLF